MLVKEKSLYDLNIQDFKENISIYEFIKNLGGNWRLKKDGRNVKAYLLDEKDPTIKKASLIIARLDKEGKTTEVYFNTDQFDKSKSKSIIDFVGEWVLGKVNIEKKDFFEIKKILHKYIQSDKFVNIENSTIDIPLKSTNNNPHKPKIAVEYEPPQKAVFDYLKSRGIDHSTYMDPIFLSSYGNYKMPVKNSKMEIINHVDKPAFPLFINKKLQTLQWIDIKTDDKRSKYFQEGIDRNGAMFMSTIKKETNTLILIESPEKAMAHYQLFKESMKDNKIHPLYASSCGNFTSQDMITIKGLQNEYPQINKTVLAFDNDDAGHKFTLNYLLSKHEVYDAVIDTVPKQLYSELDTVPKLPMRLFLNAPSKPITELIPQQNQLEQIFNSIPTQKQWGSTILSLHDLTKTLPNTIIHESFTKDFLDDLKEGYKNPFNPKNFTSEVTKNKSQNLNL
jgi:hypothetical protein